MQRVTSATGFWRGGRIGWAAVVAVDVKHSQHERRFFALGKTDGDRRLFVVFTLRGGLLRVISARDMSRKERDAYERHQGQSEE